jgi:hypothetical protein
MSDTGAQKNLYTKRLRHTGVGGELLTVVKRKRLAQVRRNARQQRANTRGNFRALFALDITN